MLPSHPKDLAPQLRRWLGYVLLWDLGLLLFSAAIELTWRFRDTPEAIKRLARASSEDGLITWTSIVSMFCLGLACLILGARTRRLGWRLTGLFFVYLSMDDGALIHERLGDLLGSKDSGVYFWVLSVMPVIALFGVLCFWHLWRAARGQARLRQGILLAFCMWGLALSCEILERPLRLEGQTLRGISLHRYLMFFEEALELLAPLLMLLCVLRLLERVGEVERPEQVPLPQPSAQEPGAASDRRAA